MYAYRVSKQDPRIGLTALMAATALYLAVSMPHAPGAAGASAVGALAAGPGAFVERIAEWRPQGPPPWGDADQAASDEVEPAGRPSADSSERIRPSSGEIRGRGER